jgi:hypothetical protein
MQVGDLVWSVCPFSVLGDRLAIIIHLDESSVNPYTIHLVVCGGQGKTCKKYLAPMDSNKSVKN